LKIFNKKAYFLGVAIRYFLNVTLLSRVENSNRLCRSIIMIDLKEKTLTDREKSVYSTLPDPNDLPFGITLKDIDKFDQKQMSNRTDNAPLRKERQKRRYCMLVDTPVDSIFTPEVLDALSEGTN
jgi:hypothetical protein